MSKREHKSGKETGYETDGISYWVAPMYRDSWARVRDQQAAWDAVVTATASAAVEAKTLLFAAQRDWWSRVIADLGLDTSQRYEYNLLEGKISPVGDKPGKEAGE